MALMSRKPAPVVSGLPGIVPRRQGIHMTIDVDKLEAGVRFFDRLLEVLSAQQLSHAAVGIFVRIADNDQACMTTCALTACSAIDNEQNVLAALRELEDLGFVRLQRTKEPDGTWTTLARVTFAPESPDPD